MVSGATILLDIGWFGEASTSMHTAWSVELYSGILDNLVELLPSRMLDDLVELPMSWLLDGQV